MGGLAITPHLDLRGADTAVILGSGLGDVCGDWPSTGECSFDEVPGLSSARIAGHEGVVRKCLVAGKQCLFVMGRKHCYEGGVGQVSALIDFISGLGAGRLLLTSAAGSLTRSIRPGEIGIAEDLLDLQFCSYAVPPVVRRCPDGSRAGEAPVDTFSDRLYRERPHLGGPYGVDRPFTDLVEQAAGTAGITLRRGVIASMAGPTYETPAEVALLRKIGVHFVTMSAAPEMRFAVERGMSVAALAIVTNYATGISGVKLAHDEVLEIGARAAGSVRAIVRQLIELQ
jgi:purine-nucleoside phosphorylase